MEAKGKTRTDFIKKSVLTDDKNVINVLPDNYMMASLLGTSQLVQKNKTKRSGRRGIRRRIRRNKKGVISSVILGDVDDENGENIDDDDDDDELEDDEFLVDGFEMDEEGVQDDDGLNFIEDDEVEETGEVMKTEEETISREGRTVILKKSNYVVTDYDPITSYLATLQQQSTDDIGEDEMNEMVENAEIGGVPIFHSYGLDVEREKDKDSGEVKYRTRKKRIKHGDIIRTSELNIRLRIMEQCIHPTVKEILDQRKVLDDPEVQREIKRNKEMRLEKIIDDIVGSVVG